jgi:hypothetical protein
MEFAVVNRFTGKIIKTGSVPDADVPKQVTSGDDLVIAGSSPDGRLFYYEGEVLTPRPRLVEQTEVAIEANGLDIYTVNNIPAGTVVLLNGATQGPVDDGTLEFSTIFAGPHYIELKPPMPWQEQVIKLVAE